MLTQLNSVYLWICEVCMCLAITFISSHVHSSPMKTSTIVNFFLNVLNFIAKNAIDFALSSCYRNYCFSPLDIRMTHAKQDECAQIANNNWIPMGIDGFAGKRIVVVVKGTSRSYSRCHYSLFQAESYVCV